MLPTITIRCIFLTSKLSVIVIVDAYNLLKRLFGGPNVAEHEVERALQKMEARARKRGYKVITIFDGGYTPFPTRETMGALVRVDVGAGHAADDYIVQSVAQQIPPILVVTADRQLGMRVKSRTVAVVDPEDFWKLISRQDLLSPVRSSRAPATPLDASRNVHIDQLMQEAARTVYHAKEQEECAVQRDLGRLKRDERHWQLLLEKL